MSDIKTRSALKSLITTNFPSGTGAISAANLREWANAITESALLLLEAGEADYIVINMSTTTPPGSPSDGDAYVVAASATGAWSGQDNNVAIWDATESPAAWNFVTPTDGMAVWNLADDTQYRWDAGISPAAWTSTGGIAANDFSGAKVTLSANQAISASTNTVIDWDGTEEYDTASYHESVTNPDRITIPSDGYYRITFVPRTDQESSTNAAQYWITKNGTTFADRVAYSDAYGASHNAVPCIFEGLLTAGDIMRAMMFSTAATDLRSSDAYLAIQKIG